MVWPQGRQSNPGPTFLTRRRVVTGAKLLSQGVTRSDIIRYYIETEGVGEFRAAKLYRMANQELVRLWEEVERPQLTAALLSTSLAQARAAQEAGDAAGAAAHLANVAALARLNG
jgi:hypothetical protein